MTDQVDDHGYHIREKQVVVNFRMEEVFRLTRIMRESLKSESHLCYKHVVKTVFMASREAFACLILPRHSVCCSAI
jgi:hypothetical protein